LRSSAIPAPGDFEIVTAALFVIGVMSVPWMAFVAALIAAEKLLPWRRAAVGTVTALLITLALGVAFVPERVPGLTVPGSLDKPVVDHGSSGESEMR